MSGTKDRMTFALISRTLMISTGLILLAFAATHLLNLAAGLISVAAMDAVHPWTSGIWLDTPLYYLLNLVFFVHFFLALRLIYLRTTLFGNTYDTIQMVSGAAIIPLMAPHVLGVITSNDIMPDVDYALLMQLFWLNAPYFSLLQTALVVALWAHGSIGLVTWLRTKTWGARRLGWVYPVLVLIPILALLGYVEGGREVMIKNDPNRDRAAAAASGAAYVAPRADRADANPRPDRREPPPPPPIPNFPPLDKVLDNGMTVLERLQLNTVMTRNVQWGAVLLVLLTLLARAVRVYLGRSGTLIVRYANGPEVKVRSGPNLLEIARRHDVPHANLCRGRGRCGTCTVRILSENMGLAEPSPLERRTLNRLNADADVRLACQVSPLAGTIELERLVSPEFSLRSKYQYDDDLEDGFLTDGPDAEPSV